MQAPKPRTRARPAPPVPAPAVPSAPAAPAAEPSAAQPPPAGEAGPGVHALAAPRPRGRPRKTAADVDDGNRRRDLMDQAARLFISQGYAATSTRDIAAAAGMHSGSPYYHFKSKSALLHALMSEGMAMAEQSQRATLQALPEGVDPREQLRVLVRHHFEILLGPRSGFIPVMLYEWRSLTPAQRKGIGRIKDRYEAAWMPTLQALADSGVLQAEPAVARLYLFGALNWSVNWFSPRKGLSLDALTEQALQLFIRKD